MLPVPLSDFIFLHIRDSLLTVHIAFGSIKINTNTGKVFKGCLHFFLFSIDLPRYKDASLPRKAIVFHTPTRTRAYPNHFNHQVKMVIHIYTIRFGGLHGFCQWNGKFLVRTIPQSSAQFPRSPV